MNKQEAYKQGSEAFKNGKQAAPVLNQSFFKEVFKLETHDERIAVMDAYLMGWHKANLAQEVK
jgi:hypothetical protein